MRTNMKTLPKVSRTSVWLALLCVMILSTGCNETLFLEPPSFRNGGMIGQSKPLPEGSQSMLEGVWSVEQGRDRFGDSVVIKVSGDRLTIYARPNVGYMVLETGYLDSVVFLEGYWREQVNTNTGLVRLIVPKDDGGGWIVTGGERPDSLVISGAYGSSEGANPDQDFAIKWVRPFSAKAMQPFAAQLQVRSATL